MLGSEGQVGRGSTVTKLVESVNLEYRDINPNQNITLNVLSFIGKKTFYSYRNCPLLCRSR